MKLVSLEESLDFGCVRQNGYGNEYKRVFTVDVILEGVQIIGVIYLIVSVLSGTNCEKIQ